MGGPPFFLAILGQPHGHGGQQLLHFCTSALPVCGKTHSLKYEPELRVFHIKPLIFVNNIHLLGEIQRINAQGY
jgi:hypothetical protein